MTAIPPAVTLLPLATFLASAWVAALLFYSELPDLIPTHWSVPGKATGFTPKPWGPFALPLLMTAIWLARPLLRRLTLPRFRRDGFPGAFDFRTMLTIGLVFVLYTLMVLGSVFWLRAVAVPVAVAAAVWGVFLATRPFSEARELPGTRHIRHEADWMRLRGTIGTGLVVLALGALTLVALSR